MGLSHYLFASYVFILVCVVLVICKFMFSDVKRQKKMLDDTETKLLRTYQTLEEAMDEFYDLVAESKDEMTKKYKELEDLMDAATLVRTEHRTSPAAESPSAPKASSPAPKSAPKRRTAPKKDKEPQEFSQMFLELSSRAGVPASELHERVLDMARSGKTRAEIAKELQITLNEVGLVIDINKSSDIDEII